MQGIYNRNWSNRLGPYWEILILLLKQTNWAILKDISMQIFSQYGVYYITLLLHYLIHPLNNHEWRKKEENDFLTSTMESNGSVISYYILWSLVTS